MIEKDQQLPTLDELEVFTRPFLNTNEETALLNQFAMEIPQRFQNVLVIGRFQPLHRGHIHLFKQALAISDKIIIGIGSASTLDEDNPFSADQRKHMLIATLQKENLLDRVQNIISVNDYLADDHIWFSQTLKQAGNGIEAVVGNNDWVNGIFRREGYPAFSTPLLLRERYEGKKIRSLLRSKGKL